MPSTKATMQSQNGVAGKDDRSEYALMVQHESRKVAESIRQRTIVNSATWANPLATAPSAVCTMAILLRTSGSDVAAGVKVKSRNVKDATGQDSELPHELLHANLEWCSNLGRNAFADARDAMDYINLVAVKMIEDRGKLENILSTIDEEEDESEPDDYVALASDIQDVKDDTANCLEKVENLTAAFQYWHRVIECLKVNVGACQGDTRDKAHQNKESMGKKEAEKQKLADNGKSRSDNITELQRQLEGAKKRVSEASAKVKELEGVLPVVGGLSPEEEQLLAEKAIPLEEKKKGLLGKLKEKLSGESNEEYKVRMEHQRDVEQRRAELIKQKREQREAQKRDAERVLAAARSHEKSLNNQMTKLIADVGKNKDMLASATANLTRTEAQFQRLSEEGLQLKDILDILVESGCQLGELRKQVQELVKFFRAILNEVKVAVQVEVERELLRPIEGKLTYNKSGDCNGVKRMSPKVRQRIHDSAIKVQGSFCAIRDITGVYVLVSDDYIMPAIDQMGDLADARDDEWPAKRDGFTRWCHQSMRDIQALTKATDDDMVPHMTERLQHLRLTIEPAH